jgi:hypothetical protein
MASTNPTVKVSRTKRPVWPVSGPPATKRIKREPSWVATAQNAAVDSSGFEGWDCSTWPATEIVYPGRHILRCIFQNSRELSQVETEEQDVKYDSADLQAQYEDQLTAKSKKQKLQLSSPPSSPSKLPASPKLPLSCSMSAVASPFKLYSHDYSSKAPPSPPRLGPLSSPGGPTPSPLFSPQTSPRANSPTADYPQKLGHIFEDDELGDFDDIMLPPADAV